MPYDFETLRPRHNMGAEKWLALTASPFAGEDVIPFSVADMEFSAPPCVAQALRRAVDFGVYGYTCADEGYNRAVVGWMAERHGWHIDPAWFFQTAGVMPGLRSAIRALTAPGDGVLYQPPVYPPFRGAVAENGRTPVENPLRRVGDTYEMDFDDLEAKAARPDVKLMLLCSPHNPVGRVWTRSELQRVADICSRRGVLVFSDEIHMDFTQPGRTHTVFAALEGDAARRSMIGTAASKTFNLAGLATSNLVIPDEALRKAVYRQYRVDCGEHNSYFGLAATRAAYEGGAGWLDAAIAYMTENERVFRAEMAARFPRVCFTRREGTYLLWADFSSFGLPDDTLTAFLRAAGLYLGEGTRFGTGGSGFVRVNLACPARYLRDAVRRLDEAAARRGLPR